MAAKLKVYRTAAGFHDAWVAAPSKAAALRAWGAEKDLFAIGAAEIVTDLKSPQVEAALASPGRIITQSRGGLAEQLAAAEQDGRRPRKGHQTRTKTRIGSKPASKPKPRPSREKLDAAEADVEAFERKADTALDAIRRKEEALRLERAKLERENAAQASKLQARADKAREQYDRAIAHWRASL